MHYKKLFYICRVIKTKQLKLTIMNLLNKTVRLFRNEVIGHDFTFDCDIEIFVALDGQIEDYSGCDYETAKKLISKL